MYIIYIYIYIYYINILMWFESFCWKLITKKNFSFLFLLTSVNFWWKLKKNNLKFNLFACHLIVLDCNLP